MSWADGHVKKLQEGAEVQFRPKGNSMAGKVESGSLVTVKPLGDHVVQKGDIVLCKVKGSQYLHLVKAVKTVKGMDDAKRAILKDLPPQLIEDIGKACKHYPPMQRYQIGNNKGRVNGWIGRGKIYGVLVSVES